MHPTHERDRVGGVVEREAVRVAALRAILRTLATPANEPTTHADEIVGRLLLAGYGERDICAALAAEPETVRTILLRLAR